MLTESLLLSTALAVPALLKKALTPGGTLLAWALCLVITFAGGLSAFGVLAAVFTLTVLADRDAGRRADPAGVRRKAGTRDAARVFCNVGTGGAAMALYLTTGRGVFALAYAAVMAEALADSLASKIGPLSKRPPVDILTLRPVQAGLSGGVSILGFAASAAGAAAVGGIWLAGTGDVQNGLLAAGLGFAGAVFDSFLGSAVQVKYRCRVCGAVTERAEHCGQAAALLKGMRRINNDAVNFLSGAAVFAAAILTGI